jgi:hypothetical protein
LRKFRTRIGVACIATIVAAQVAGCGRATAEDRLLTEAVEFSGTLTFLGTKVPGTTANDIARWMKWRLDAGAATDRDLRLLDHAAYLYRDGLSAVMGLDDGGPMDAMGLGWVINMQAANHPLIL